jgi:hypothetical protein
MNRPSTRLVGEFVLVNGDFLIRFVGIVFADVIGDADKGKHHLARTNPPGGKRSLVFTDC